MTESDSRDARPTAMRSGAARFASHVKLAAASCLLWIAVWGMAAVSLTTQLPTQPHVVSTDRAPSDPWFAGQARRLCRLLDGNAGGTIQMSAGRSRLKSGRVVDTVSADCVYPNGQQIASIVWIGDSRELVSFVAAGQKVSTNSGAALGAGDAILASRRWLKSMGAATRPDDWTTTEPPRADGSRWNVNLHCGPRTAKVTLDASTGMLRAARFSG